jgi:hypothetical protein
MSNFKAQMTKSKKRKGFDIESFWHLFGIWILTFELFQVGIDLFRLPARSRYGEGRDFDIRISDLNIRGRVGLFLCRLFQGTHVFFNDPLGVQPKGLGKTF